LVVGSDGRDKGEKKRKGNFQGREKALKLTRWNYKRAKKNKTQVKEMGSIGVSERAALLRFSVR